MAAPAPAPAPWQEIASRAAQKVHDSIPAAWRLSTPPPAIQKNVTPVLQSSQILTPAELVITSLSATGLVLKLAAGELSAVQVTGAFCKAAAVAHQVTNCLTVVMFEEAMERARELDAAFKRAGKPVGPLHGLPVSLKDNFNVVGRPSGIGFCSIAEEAMGANSTIVDVLLEAGAVVYVKTNVPTGMMIAESVNNCYGRTVNPWNRDLTSGGSSGGESALIAMRGSPLGVGTDIGGSLRIPASCVGIYTLRPSFGRFPNSDTRSGLAGQEAVLSVHGPMAHSLADCSLYASTVIASQPWLRDPKVLPIPWRSVQLPATLKIAVLWHNGIVAPTPVKRALRTTVDKLQAAGHSISEWPATDHAEAMDLLGRFFVADGGKSIKALLEPVQEPLRPELQPYSQAPELGVHDLWQLQRRRNALCQRFLDRWAELGNPDAILCPTSPYAAPKNGEFKTVSYTGVYNLLDYSCVSFPVPGVRADQAEDVYESGFEAVGETDEVTKRDYEASIESVHGAQVSLQLVCRRLEDEKVLAVAQKVVDAFGN